ncbi:MAG: hypothetical protein ABJH52_08245 [Henriciella sp.]
MLQSMLLVLKLLAPIVAAVFGAIGTIKEFKHPDGRITNWGKAALSGILLGSALTIAIQVFQEMADQKTEADIILRLERAVTKITTLSADATITMPEISELTGQIEAKLQQQLVHLQNETEEYDGSIVVASERPPTRSGEKPTITSVEILPESDLFPSIDRDDALGFIADTLILRISIYRSPIDEDDFFAARWTGEGQPDFQVAFDSSEPLELTYNLRREALDFTIYDETDPEFWDSTGRIVSEVDLSGAQIWFFLDAAAPPVGSEESTELLIARGLDEAELRVVAMRINGLDYFFMRDQLEEVRTINNKKAWTIILPDSLEEIYDQHVQ